MHFISDQLQQISAALVGLDPSDLQALAEVHGKFDAFLASAREAGTDPTSMEKLTCLTGRARLLLEQLILDQAEDAQRQLSSVLKTVADVQALITVGKLPDNAVPDDTIEAAMIATGVEVLVPVIRSEGLPAPAPASAAPTDQPAARLFHDDETALVEEFIAEANGHLDTAEQEMLVLEDDPSNAASLSSLFRAFHTIKGVAGFLDLRQIQSLAHITENLLDRGRSGETALTGVAAELVLAAIDMMKRLLTAVSAAIKTRSELALIHGVDDLVRRLEDLLSGNAATAAPRHSAEWVEQPNTVSAAESAVSASAAAAAANAGETHKPATDNSVKVATDRLDRLIDMVGELVIANSMVVQDLGEASRRDVRLGRHLGHLGKIVRELQDLSMSLRMVQVGTVFRKMTRVVRDTARKAIKDAELILEGTQTELDRNVVDVLGDPLMHMVRNSVDHGIEPADQRVAAGKPATGRITLRAYHKGGSINIEIADDGRGLNKEKILAKAIANGLVKEGQTLTDQEVFKLIFAAGLSTAEKVTDISGRGVGMDVVRQNIERLRGRIEIASTPGQGSVFTIRLPLTLAVIDGLVVKVGSEKYIIPINSIEQSFRPAADQLSTVQDKGELVLIRGRILPLVRLHRIFGVTPRNDDPTQSILVIVQDNDRQACVLVDELLGQEQVVIKSLGEGMGPLKGISGGAVLGDGNVSLILDIPGVIDLTR